MVLVVMNHPFRDRAFSFGPTWNASAGHSPIKCGDHGISTNAALSIGDCIEDFYERSSSAAIR